jgi:hypothetical protein
MTGQYHNPVIQRNSLYGLKVLKAVIPFFKKFVDILGPSNDARIKILNFSAIESPRKKNKIRLM